MSLQPWRSASTTCPCRPQSWSRRAAASSMPISSSMPNGWTDPSVTCRRWCIRMTNGSCVTSSARWNRLRRSAAPACCAFRVSTGACAGPNCMRDPSSRHRRLARSFLSSSLWISPSRRSCSTTSLPERRAGTPHSSVRSPASGTTTTPSVRNITRRSGDRSAAWIWKIPCPPRRRPGLPSCIRTMLSIRFTPCSARRTAIRPTRF